MVECSEGQTPTIKEFAEFNQTASSIFCYFNFFPKPPSSPSIFGHQPTLLLPCIHSTKKNLELNKNDENVNLELLFVNIKCFTVCTGNNMTVQYIDFIWNLQRRKCNLIIEK